MCEQSLEPLNLAFFWTLIYVIQYKRYPIYIFEIYELVIHSSGDIQRREEKSTETTTTYDVFKLHITKVKFIITEWNWVTNETVHL